MTLSQAVWLHGGPQCACGRCVSTYTCAGVLWPLCSWAGIARHPEQPCGRVHAVSGRRFEAGLCFEGNEGGACVRVSTESGLHLAICSELWDSVLSPVSQVTEWPLTGRCVMVVVLWPYGAAGHVLQVDDWTRPGVK